MCAKTHPALVGLTQALEKRTMKKRYRAIVRGHLEGCGRITLALSGKECWTEYRAVSHSTSALCGSITTVDLWPHTGRCAAGPERTLPCIILVSHWMPQSEAMFALSYALRMAAWMQ